MATYSDYIGSSRGSGTATSPIEERDTAVRRRVQHNGSGDWDLGWASAEASASGTPHPLTPELSRSASPSDQMVYDVSDASRPSLRRLTSELEREVANASVVSRSSVDDLSVRGSFDMLRTALGKAAAPNEVEVLVHDVKPKESLVGIALLYGIELPTLRKVNKLWPSDPVHLRRHLYVPLEACRWGQASETFVRGPGEGQITLIPKSALRGQDAGNLVGEYPGFTSDKGKGKERDPALAQSFLPTTNVAYGSLIDLDSNSEGRPSSSRSGSANLADLVKGVGAGSQGGSDSSSTMVASPVSLVPAINLITPSPIIISDGPTHPQGTVLSVIRIPASELAFFPKARQAPARKSLDALSPIHEPPTTVRRAASTNFPSPLKPSVSLPNGSASEMSPAYKKRFAPPTMTSTSHNIVEIRPAGGPPPPGSKSRSGPSISDLVGLEGLSLNGLSNGSLKQAKDRPFEMTDRNGNGVIALPLSKDERKAGRKAASAMSSWFSVADDGLDPGTLNGGWG